MNGGECLWARSSHLVIRIAEMVLAVAQVAVARGHAHGASCETADPCANEVGDARLNSSFAQLLGSLEPD